MSKLKEVYYKVNFDDPSTLEALYRELERAGYASLDEEIYKWLEIFDEIKHVNELLSFEIKKKESSFSEIEIINDTISLEVRKKGLSFEDIYLILDKGFSSFEGWEVIFDLYRWRFIKEDFDLSIDIAEIKKGLYKWDICSLDDRYRLFRDSLELENPLTSFEPYKSLFYGYLVEFIETYLKKGLREAL